MNAQRLLFTLAVLLLSWLLPMTTATARCYNPTPIVSRLEQQLREEDALKGKTAYTGVFDPGPKVQIGLLRWYDPNLQRWINRDPIGEAKGINLYQFAGNDPVNMVDPDGLTPLLFDTEAYGQLWQDSGIPGFLRRNVGDPLRNFFIGNPRPGGDACRYSNLALRGQEGVGTDPGADAVEALGTGLLAAGAMIATLPFGMEELAIEKAVHKNSLEYIGDTHVYRIIGPDGATFKIGESARGLTADGLSIRAEAQVRRLIRENGPGYQSEIRKTFGSKAEARAYERRLIERFRSMYGDDTLPGNKSYH